jgi:site-specific DNA-methyltransferase (adenine-specific)
MRIGNGEFWLGDCLELMRDIPDASVDMILCDLPYGTTACKWDVVIPFELLWGEYWRIIKPNCAIVLTGDEPFSSLLRLSSLGEYKYDWYWRKSRPAGFTNAKLKPLKDIETISVFSKGMSANGSKINMPYMPQGLSKVDRLWKRPKHYLEGDSGVNPGRKSHSLERIIENTNYPRQVLDFTNSNKKLIHPTQKPIELFEYFIKTYTEEGMTILDNCAGSGTTAIAAERTGRRWICIEREPQYYYAAVGRIWGECGL